MCMCFGIRGKTAQKRRVFICRYLRIQYLSLTCKMCSTCPAPWLVWWQIVCPLALSFVSGKFVLIDLLAWTTSCQYPQPPWWLGYPWSGTATLHYCNWIGWFWRTHNWVNMIKDSVPKPFCFQMGLNYSN